MKLQQVLEIIIQTQEMILDLLQFLHFIIRKIKKFWFMEGVKKRILGKNKSLKFFAVKDNLKGY